jgi:glycosyltransferase involved in cell wall biosynthesis
MLGIGRVGIYLCHVLLRFSCIINGMILFGHPGGNPNAHHAALAHLEGGRLEAFCVPWMPSKTTLRILSVLPGLGVHTGRLARRRFEPLMGAPRIEGRLGEMRRLLTRAFGSESEGLSYEANDWLMDVMKRECHRSTVTAVHAFEDCSLWQFEEAKRLGKACIYDMPTVCYSAWEEQQKVLLGRFSNWLPSGGLSANQWARPEQKRREMEIADVVLAPSTVVKETILRFHPDKKISLAPYGVDLDYWTPSCNGRSTKCGPLLFLYAGRCSIRKGIPVLLDAWRKAELREAKLALVGSWELEKRHRGSLPPGVVYHPPCSAAELRTHYRNADVFLFPSFFDGFGLVLLEAMACGLPVVATEATAGPDIIDATMGRIVASGNVDALVETLRWFAAKRNHLPAMKVAARAKAETCTWARYRRCVSEAVAGM